MYYIDTVKEASLNVNETQRLALQEWIDFLEHAAKKKETDIVNIKTKGIKEAYEKITAQNLPIDVKAANEKHRLVPLQKKNNVLVRKVNKKEE